MLSSACSFVVRLGYGATHDLAGGCWYSTFGGYPEVPWPPRFLVVTPAKSVKSADSADWLVKRARCVVIFDHRNLMRRTKRCIAQKFVVDLENDTDKAKMKRKWMRTNSEKKRLITKSL